MCAFTCHFIHLDPLNEISIITNNNNKCDMLRWLQINVFFNDRYFLTMQVHAFMDTQIQSLKRKKIIRHNKNYFTCIILWRVLDADTATPEPAWPSNNAKYIQGIVWSN